LPNNPGLKNFSHYWSNPTFISVCLYPSQSLGGF